MENAFVVFVKLVVDVVVVVEAEMLSTIELVGRVVEPGVTPLRARVRTGRSQAVVVVLVLDAFEVIRIWNE